MNSLSCLEFILYQLYFSLMKSICINPAFFFLGNRKNICYLVMIVLLFGVRQHTCDCWLIRTSRHLLTTKQHIYSMPMNQKSQMKRWWWYYYILDWWTHFEQRNASILGHIHKVKELVHALCLNSIRQHQLIHLHHHNPKLKENT